jgi:hypothetical protein
VSSGRQQQHGRFGPYSAPSLYLRQGKWRHRLSPAYTASAPSSSSMRSSWLYFASRSDRHGAPAFICPHASPTCVDDGPPFHPSVARWF